MARSEDKLNEVGGAEAVITAGDLNDPEVRQRAVDTTIERFGSLDILINNAGIGLYKPTWLAEISDVRAMMELNLMVPIALTQLVVPHMARQRSGVIVNVGSIAGKVTLPWLTLYSASKYALGSLTDGLRMELKGKGIHAITVCPGYVKTSFHDHVLAGQVPDSIRRSRKAAITAHQCAEAIARGVEKEKRTVMAPRVGWVLVALERLFPSLVDWQLRRLYRSVE
jgi:short-subunit dehydrogenase